MRKTLIALALVATPLAAEAQARKDGTALLGPHLVCATIAQAALLYESPQDAQRLGSTFINDGTCVILPPGTRTWIGETQGVFTCLHTERSQRCAWTVLVERQAREFRERR